MYESFNKYLYYRSVPDPVLPDNVLRGPAPVLHGDRPGAIQQARANHGVARLPALQRLVINPLSEYYRL